MKKICLIILVVLLLPVTISFAAPLPTGTVQQISIPFTIVGDGYWSGLAIHNTSSNSMTFTTSGYTSGGTYQSGSSSFTVAPHAMESRVVENFFGGTAPSVQMSVRIRSTTNVPFKATLFVGSENGFGFQNYTSEEYTYPLLSDPVD